MSARTAQDTEQDLEASALLNELREANRELVRVIGICADVMEERAGLVMLHPSAWGPFEQAAILARQAVETGECV